jgi:hypothetical protein
MIVKISKNDTPSATSARAKLLQALAPDESIAAARTIAWRIERGETVTIVVDDDPDQAAVDKLIASRLFEVAVSDENPTPWPERTEKIRHQQSLLARAVEGDAAAAIEYCKLAAAGKIIFGCIC